MRFTPFRRQTAALLLVAAGGCRPVPAAPLPHTVASSAGSNASLRAAIDSMIDSPQFASAHWGILIVDQQSGDTLYARNAGKLFMPASNMKLLTAATALAQLGPDYRFRTTFATQDAIVDGVVTGNLLVTGRGDPSVSDRMFGDAMRPLRGVADSLAAGGVRRIAGRVIADGNAFPGEVFGYGWSYDDFEHAYSAPVDELLFNEGFSELHVRGGARPGDPVQIAVRPGGRYPVVRADATTGRQQPSQTGGSGNTLTAIKDSATWDVVVRGEIAAGDSATIDVTQHDPDAAYVAAVEEALAERGIAVGGAVHPVLDAPDRQRTLVTLSSPPLRDILRAMLKPSQNQVAEMVFRTLALEATGIGRSDSASAVVQRQLGRWNIPPSEAVVRDGSGLARYDYVSPRTVVRVLAAAHASPYFAIFYEALPVAGVDGTLRHRMQHTAAANNVHAKTGSLALARSLSGYVTTADHHMLIFSLLANNWTVDSDIVEQVQDAIVERLAAMRLP